MLAAGGAVLAIAHVWYRLGRESAIAFAAPVTLVVSAAAAAFVVVHKFLDGDTFSEALAAFVGVAATAVAVLGWQAMRGSAARTTFSSVFVFPVIT